MTLEFKDGKTLCALMSFTSLTVTPHDAKVNSREGGKKHRPAAAAHFSGGGRVLSSRKSHSVFCFALRELTCPRCDFQGNVIPVPSLDASKDFSSEA